MLTLATNAVKANHLSLEATSKDTICMSNNLFATLNTFRGLSSVKGNKYFIGLFVF